MEMEQLPMTLEQRCLRDKELLESLAFGETNAKTDQQEEKKPRRKDTPVLNCPPHVPGVKVLQDKKQTIHLEDNEEDHRE